MSAPRLLYLPDEGTEGDQFGPRRVLAGFAAGGLLGGLETHSFLVEAARHGVEASHARLLERARAFAPDAILWQHPHRHPVPDGLVAALKALPSRPVLALHEGDMYGGRAKPVTAGLRAVLRGTDVAFLVGLGEWAETVRALGARRVVYVPSAYDEGRFGTPWTPPDTRPLDVVMIGNLSRPRLPLPGRTLPGLARRLRVVRGLHRAFGPRFGVYGTGWGRAPFARGPLPYGRQEEALRGAWASVGWNHYDTVPGYFSDRLPIALASGVAHFTNAQPGLDRLFRPGVDLVWDAEPEGLVARVREAFAAGPDALARLGAAGQATARAHLTTEAVFRTVLDELRGALAERSAP